MKYLVLGHHLYPIPDANGICLMNILNEIQKSGNDVKVISQVSEKSNEINDGNTIRFYHHQLLSWSGCKTVFERLRYITRRLITLFNYPRIDESLVKKYVTSSRKVTDNEEIDVILCVCNPIESVEAAVRLKYLYPGKKLVIYNIDTISDVPFPKIEQPIAKYLSKKAYQWEKRVFNKADVIVNLNCHKSHFSSNNYKDYYNRMLFQDVPMLINPAPANSLVSENRDYLTLIYAGSFYRAMREPSILLHLFSGISVPQIKLKIFTSGSYCEIIKNMLVEKSNFQVASYLTPDALNNEIMKSDFLISLGNKESNMFPSKIVSYIAYGKPIIHIFQDELDPVLNYLKPYPEKLLIDNRGDANENRQKISDFLKVKHSLVDWNTIICLYKESTPLFCAHQVIKCIDG